MPKLNPKSTPSEKTVASACLSSASASSIHTTPSTSTAYKVYNPGPALKPPITVEEYVQEQKRAAAEQEQEQTSNQTGSITSKLKSYPGGVYALVGEKFRMTVVSGSLFVFCLTCAFHECSCCKDVCHFCRLSFAANFHGKYRALERILECAGKRWSTVRRSEFFDLK